MEVRLLMHRPGVTCEPGTSLRDAARRMEDEGIGTLLVVDHHGALAGIVTDRDITLRAVGRGLLPEASIESVMSREPTTVYGYDDAFSAATLMATKGCRRLPVLDHDGHLEGVISLDDLVIVFTEQLDKLVHTVALEQGPAHAEEHGHP
jgi:CBS domain-containing protein